MQLFWESFFRNIFVEIVLISRKLKSRSRTGSKLHQTFPVFCMRCQISYGGQWMRLLIFSLRVDWLRQWWSLWLSCNRSPLTPVPVYQCNTTVTTSTTWANTGDTSEPQAEMDTIRVSHVGNCKARVNMTLVWQMVPSQTDKYCGRGRAHPSCEGGLLSLSLSLSLSVSCHVKRNRQTPAICNGQ